MRPGFRIACLALALIAPAGFSGMTAGSGPSFEAKISFSDGTVQNARLTGVGCTQSICSRIVIKGEDASHRLVSLALDSLAAIRGKANGALFISKDGKERRLSLIKDFRVLYLETQSGGAEKLDLESIESIEFIGVQR